jgi:polysaccharide pyruvyl transferase WcaK-like protein
MAVCDALKIRPKSEEPQIALGFDMALLLTDNMLNKMRNESANPRFLINIRPCPKNKALPEQFARAVSLNALKNAPEGHKKSWKSIWKNAKKSVAKNAGPSQDSLRGIALWDADLCGVALADEDEQLMSKLIKNGTLPAMPIERVKTIEDAARVWSGAVGAAGMRLHFSALSVMAETPSLAVPYAPKIEAFAKAYDIPLWSYDAKQKFTQPLPLLKIPTFREPIDQARLKIDELCHIMLGENAETVGLA